MPLDRKQKHSKKDVTASIYQKTGLKERNFLHISSKKSSIKKLTPEKEISFLFFILYSMIHLLSDQTHEFFLL